MIPRSRPVRECRKVQLTSYFENRKQLAAYYASPVPGVIGTPPWETLRPDSATVVSENPELAIDVSGTTEVPSAKNKTPTPLSKHTDVDCHSETSRRTSPPLVTSEMLPPPEDAEAMHARTVSALILANRKIEELTKEITDLKAQHTIDLAVQAIQPKTPTVVPKPVLHSNTNAHCTELLLFRASGRLQILSNFYEHNLVINHTRFKSAEHAYQHKKAVFHNRRDIATRIHHSTTPYAAKKISKSITQCRQWHECKADIMLEILKEKAKQCPAFRKALLNTGSKHLVHNTETDSFWGCGEDFQGQNTLGCLLENLRQDLLLKPMSPVVAGDVPAKPPQACPPRYVGNVPRPSTHTQPKLIVVGNSNARGIARGLIDRGIDASGFCLPGATISHITSRIRHTKPSHDPDLVLLMAGDIEAANHHPAENICARYEHLLKETKRTFPWSRVVVSGLPTAGDNLRQATIRKVNNYLQGVASDDRLVEYVSNTHAKLRDDIHLSRTSKERLCMNVAQVSKKVFV